MSDSSDDSYFQDPSTQPTPRSRIDPPPARLADEEGYVVRRSVLDEGTRPEFVIPVGAADGVWGMIKRVGRYPGEGWLSLWKGRRLCLMFPFYL